MEQRDIIKDQIEQMGRVLGKALNELLRFKTEGDSINQIILSQEILQKESNIEIEQLIDWDKETLNHFLKDQHFNSHSAENLGDYLIHWGYLLMDQNTNKSIQILRQAVNVFNFAEKNSSIFSIERAAKINRLNFNLEI